MKINNFCEFCGVEHALVHSDCCEICNEFLYNEQTHKEELIKEWENEEFQKKVERMRYINSFQKHWNYDI